MKSPIFSINLKDVGKGLATAVFAGAALAVFAVLQGVFNSPGFDLFSIDWISVAHSALNAAVIGAEGGFTGYIMKNFFSDQDGKVFGKIG